MNNHSLRIIVFITNPRESKTYLTLSSSLYITIPYPIINPTLNTLHTNIIRSHIIYTQHSLLSNLITLTHSQNQYNTSLSILNQFPINCISSQSNSTQSISTPSINTQISHYKYKKYVYKNHELCYNRVIGKEVYIVLEKVGIIVAFLISLTVLTINSLTIVEKVRNLKNGTSKKKKRIRKRLRPKRQRQRIRR